MKFYEYTQKTIARLKLNSQNDVARALNITTASMSNFNTGKAFPSESTMLKLAELAGVEKEKALIDLNMWRAKDDADRLAVWQRISKMIGCFIITTLNLLVKCAAVSHILTMCNVYYVYLKKKIKSNFKSLVFVN